MLLACEETVKRFLPAIRVGLSKKLKNEYKFNQVEIASILGITQAAVSKYLSGKYTEWIRKLENSKNVRDAVKELGLLIAKQKVDKQTLAYVICKYCTNLKVCDKKGD